jgi:hypothetical protein
MALRILCKHLGRELLDSMDHAPQINADDPLPIVPRCLPWRPTGSDSGVIRAEVMKKGQENDFQPGLFMNEKMDSSEIQVKSIQRRVRGDAEEDAEG